MKFNCKFSELRNINSLVPHPKNPNEHSEDQIKRLSEIISYQGQRSPIVISRTSGYIVVGHGRWQAMRQLGWEKVAVDVQDFQNEDQEYAHLTADNAIAEWAVLDLGKINQNVENLGPDFNIDLLGLKDFAIEPIEKLDPGLVDEDDVPEVKEPITKRGDVWLLGDHRVMCGDSTMMNDVEKLMAGEKIDLVHTDPPYGIKEDASKRKGRDGLTKTNSDLVNFDDSNTDAARDAFVLCEGLNIKRQVWWGANYYAHALPETANWFVWDKRLEDKEKNTNSDCELAWVKSKWSSVRIFRHLWKGLIKGSEHGQKRVHPTQKPVALAEWVIDYYKSDFKNVMDLFGGSGSTLIACQNKNKRCFTMEFSEHYCDVIVKRWQNYTGRKAVLESNGKTYDELVASNV